MLPLVAIALRSKAMLPLVAIALLCSCSLLPVEEEAPPPPLLRSYEKTEYNFAEVTRGVIEDKRRISCQYSPALEESLGFSVGGILIDSVYVENGDVVKKGDILAELDRSQLNSQIDAQKLTLDKLKLSRSQLTDTYRINLETENVKLAELQEEKNAARIAAQERTIRTLTDNYELQLDIYNTRIKTAAAKLAELEAQAAARVLVAGIDGTVTYIKETNPYSTSVENEKFITLADKTSSVFIVSGGDAAYFKPGDLVTVLLSNEEREATVIDASELGLEPSDRLAYVRLNETAFDIKERATGSITLIFDSRADVLQIPQMAVKSANGKSIVYCLDETGVKTMREVETGFTADNKVEILSGLELGDKVIID